MWERRVELGQWETVVQSVGHIALTRVQMVRRQHVGKHVAMTGVLWKQIQKMRSVRRVEVDFL
jgi:hypothetical protein